MDFEFYKDQLLKYLETEKELLKADIIANSELTDVEKIERGYLIEGCCVADCNDGCYDLKATINNSKLRAGDRVVLTKEGESSKMKAVVVENFFDTITLIPDSPLDYGAVYSIHVVEAVLLDHIITLLGNLQEGGTGSLYIKELFGLKDPKDKGFFTINHSLIDTARSFNSVQLDAIKSVLNRPSLYSIQGPPGTGKTDVLSEIAQCFSKSGYEVLVVSNTHQAVNNALNKIAKNIGLPIVKIGEVLKAKELVPSIKVHKTFSEYLKTRPSRRRLRDKGTIIGMTIHTAIIYQGLQSNSFSPSVILVDEAGQMPLTYGATIGTFGAGSIVFIGDDRQMPPLFHSGLHNNELSISVFEHVSKKYPQHKTVLDTTYRMNTEITDVVSKNFYEPYGIKLKSSIRPTFDQSFEICNCMYKDVWRDYNVEEAKKVAQKALEYVRKGEEVAIITPFRKQVNCIAQEIKDLFTKEGISSCPLVDTVERLQGQDVDVIIISFSVSDSEYYKQLRTFIEDSHRLNVMISRAKKKVILFKSDFVLHEFQEHSQSRVN